MTSFVFLIALPPFLLASPAPLSVSQIVASRDQYVGQRIQVAGTIRIIPRYSRLPCPGNVQPCNPIASVSVFIADPSDSAKQLLIYQGGEPYKCSYDVQGNFKCPPFTDNASLTLEGIYYKGKESTGIIGSASPAAGGSPPQVTTSKEFYYLDMANFAQPAGRKAK